MLLAAMRAQAAAATTAASTATAATASAEAVEVDDSTSAEFDSSDKPKMPLALNKVLNESDIAAARDLIQQVGVIAGVYHESPCVETLCAAQSSGLGFAQWTVLLVVPFPAAGCQLRGCAARLNSVCCFQCTLVTPAAWAADSAAMWLLLLLLCRASHTGRSSLGAGTATG
jgi:hypothetical protein